MKILDSYWFNSGGIIRVQTQYEGIKYYIKGLADMTTADNDANDIANWGNTFPTKAGDALFGIKNENDTKNTET